MSTEEQARGELIRQRLSLLSREQKQVLLDLCLRREQLHLTDRARLFAAVAEVFASRFGLTPAEMQSDEKFVLQLAGVLDTDRLAPKVDEQVGQPSRDRRDGRVWSLGRK
jgi:hypothetical protein